MNTITTPNRDPRTGRYVKVLLAVINGDDPAMEIREPDYYEAINGRAVWIGPSAAVSVDGGIERVREILGAPRLVEFLTPQRAKGWFRVPASHYGAEVSKYPGRDHDDDVPTAQESWDLMREAVGL